MKALNYLRLFAAYSLLSFFSLASMAQDQLSKPESGFYLPFTEDWHYGNFTSNLWQTGSDNWKIDSQNGNEKPSAKFHRTGVLSNYSSSLLSNTIDAQNIKVGHVYLKFDLKLDDYNNNGSEYLKIKVKDSTGWHTIDSLSNTGSFDWETHTYDIKDYSIGQVFQFKFEATGQNSMNILDWFIDNIEVYRECDAPEDLTLDIVFHLDDFGAEVEWNAPESVFEQEDTLKYGDGSNYSALSLDDTQNAYCAIRYDQGSLNKYENDTIESLSIFLNDSGFDFAIIKIWIGQNAVSEIYSDTVENPLSGEWTTVDISTPIIILKNTEYWFGYEIVNPIPSKYILGTDNGPATSGYGDKIKLDNSGWDNLSDFGLDYNWNIKVSAHASAVLDPNTLLGFNVFRKVGQEPTFSFTDFVDFDDTLKHYLHFQSHITFPDSSLYFGICYQVNGVWAFNSDTCISDFAFNLNIPAEDTTCVFITGNNESEKSWVALYPNPATSSISIKSAELFTDIYIYNNLGSIVKQTENNNRDCVTMDIGLLKPGLYFIMAKTNDDVIIRKFIKQ
ncbi:MAG: T9SS type A sorting domain-containing protein [Chlorobi bacterium]|nr:T9SS type A sorting domain-containing protein [Chlorobiota bacterium]